MDLSNENVLHIKKDGIEYPVYCLNKGKRGT